MQASSPANFNSLCERDDGRCPICDSYVRPTTIVHICDECAFGNYAGTSDHSRHRLIAFAGKYVSFVADRVSVMRTTARIVRGLRKTGMGVQRLLIWEVRGRTCFTRRESWARLGLFLVVQSRGGPMPQAGW
jgi:hypothetical protein